MPPEFLRAADEVRLRLLALDFPSDDRALLEWLLEHSFMRGRAAAYYRSYRTLGPAAGMTHGHAHTALGRLTRGRVVQRLGECWPHWLAINTTWLDWDTAGKDPLYPPRQRPPQWDADEEEQPPLAWPPLLRHLLVEQFVESHREGLPAPRQAGGRVPDAATVQETLSAGQAGERRSADEVAECGSAPPSPAPVGDSVPPAPEVPAWRAELERLKAELGGSAVEIKAGAIAPAPAQKPGGRHSLLRAQIEALRGADGVPAAAVPETGTSVPAPECSPGGNAGEAAPGAASPAVFPPQERSYSVTHALKSESVSTIVPNVQPATLPERAAAWLRGVDTSAVLSVPRYAAAWYALCAERPRYVLEVLPGALERGVAAARRRGESRLQRPLVYLAAAARSDGVLRAPAGEGRRGKGAR